MGLLVDLPKLTEIAEEIRGSGRTIALCHGVFDLLHPGHIMHFKDARKHADVLMVTVTADQYVDKGPNRPAFTHALRAYSIVALDCVDYVSINSAYTSENVVQAIKPDFYVKGADYIGSTSKILIRECNLVEEHGGEVVFTETPLYSSSELVNEFFNELPGSTVSFLADFHDRYDLEYFDDLFNRILPLNVLVIGDIIVDRVVAVEIKGRASKSGILSTKYISEEDMAGGVLHIANHVAEFCNVDLITSMGDDRLDAFIETHLGSRVTPNIWKRGGTYTTTKIRFTEPHLNLKMYEMAKYEDSPLPMGIVREMCNHISDNAESYDMIIIADYGHGVLSDAVVGVINALNIPISLMVQTNSLNYGFNLVTKYDKANYVCIDEQELRLAMSDSTSSIVDLVRKLAPRFDGIEFISLTRGHEGSVTYDVNNDIVTWVPSLTNRVVDATGAGDVYLAVTAPCIHMGCSSEVAGFLGNAGGALAVQIQCNKLVVTKENIRRFIKAILSMRDIHGGAHE